MSFLILISLAFCTVKTLSYLKWCLNNDKKNIIGNVSVLLLNLGLIATGVIIYLNVN